MGYNKPKQVPPGWVGSRVGIVIVLLAVRSTPGSPESPPRLLTRPEVSQRFNLITSHTAPSFSFPPFFVMPSRICIGCGLRQDHYKCNDRLCGFNRVRWTQKMLEEAERLVRDRVMELKATVEERELAELEAKSSSQNPIS